MPVDPANSTAYARVLSSESFFQRARILSISTKHGFPPSKDPDGSQNRALLLSQSRSPMSQGATGANALRLKNIMENKSTDGILPAGWLEKHVHALPSVLLVVTTLSAKGSNQEAQNQHLLETMEHLKYNLAPKRECHLHIVCLMDDPSPSILTTDAWLTLVKHHTELPSTSISLLSVKDLAPDMATLSPSLRDFHATIREASLTYYLKQARRQAKTLSSWSRATANVIAIGRSILFQGWHLLRISAQTRKEPQVLFSCVSTRAIVLSVFVEWVASCGYEPSRHGSENGNG